MGRLILIVICSALIFSLLVCALNIFNFKLVSGLVWLNTVDASDIVSIRTIEGFAGVAPGRLKHVRYIYDSESIAYMLKQYKSLKMLPLFPRYRAHICGGTTFNIRFTFKGGTERTLYLNNRIYWSNLSVPYKIVSKLPKISDDMSYEAYNCFVDGNIPQGIVYSRSDDGSVTPIGEITFGSLIFKRIKIDNPEATEPYHLFVKTDFCELEFLTSTIFKYEDSYYELKDKGIDELVDTEGATQLVDAYIKKYNDGREVQLVEYLGKHSNGTVVGLIRDNVTKYESAKWSERIDTRFFSYSDSNRITVLYEGQLYTLTEAYEKEYLTNEDMRQIYIIHNFEFNTDSSV